MLLEDTFPWGFDSNHVALNMLGEPYELHYSWELPYLDLTQYSLIIISSDQPQSFYDTLAPYISPGGKLYNWTMAGGILDFHGACWGWQGSDWTISFTLPGGVSAYPYYSNDVTVVPQPIPLPPALGPYYGPLGDPDVDNLNYATHGYFYKALSASAKYAITIVVEGDKAKPCYVLYKFGKGVIIANMQPLEWFYYCYDLFGYGTPNTKYLEINDIYAAIKIDEVYG